MQTCLITGGAGFIGSHAAERLLARGDRVIGLDNFDPFYSRGIKEGNIRSALAHPLSALRRATSGTRRPFPASLRRKSPTRSSIRRPRPASGHPSPTRSGIRT